MFLVFTNFNLLILTPILSWYQEENLTDSDLVKNITFFKNKCLMGHFTKVTPLKRLKKFYKKKLV